MKYLPVIGSTRPTRENTLPVRTVLPLSRMTRPAQRTKEDAAGLFYKIACDGAKQVTAKVSIISISFQ
jgi:hypothetical protein